MKRFFTVLVITVMLLAPFAATGQSINIAYLDLQKVMLESEPGKQIRKALTDEAEKLKKNLEGRQSELQRLKDALEKQGATITPDARAERERQYQTKLRDYQRLANDYQAEMQQKDMEFTQKVLKELEEIVNGLGEREKYTLILERSQAGIMYAAPGNDITSRVISLFNEAAKKRPIVR